MSNKNNKNKGLGRGLSALMADVPLHEPSGTTTPARPDLTVPIETVEPNPDQPRRSFPEEALAELTASIREKGIPICSNSIIALGASRHMYSTQS